jgi:hypothetical protein
MHQVELVPAERADIQYASLAFGANVVPTWGFISASLGQSERVQR